MAEFYDGCANASNPFLDCADNPGAWRLTCGSCAAPWPCPNIAILPAPRHQSISPNPHFRAPSRIGSSAPGLGYSIALQTVLCPPIVGEVFLAYARELVSRASDLEREMDLLKGVEKGELRISSGTYPTHRFVDTAVVRMVREHSSVQISIVTDNGSSLLLIQNRELDLTVTERAPP